MISSRVRARRPRGAPRRQHDAGARLVWSGPARRAPTLAFAGVIAGLGAMIALSPAPSRALEARSTGQPAQMYAIPAGALGDVLAQFAAATGTPLSFDPRALRGLRSGGLQGRHTVASGFAQLLAGSGYEAVDSGGGRYVLRRAASGSAGASTDGAAAVTLPTVTVTGSPEFSTLTDGSGSYTQLGTTSEATGMKLTLRETPQTVSVITRQRMDDENLGSVGRVLDVTNGISLVRAGAAGSPAVGEIFYARGFEVTNYQLDGLPVSQLGLQAMAGTRSGIGGTPTAIYDQITVVRGATGLLNGAGNPAAAINLVRKRPTSEFRGFAELGVGRWDRVDGLVDLSGPLNVSRTVRGRVVVGQGAGGEWMDRHAGARSGVFYGVLEADLGPATLLSLGLEHTRNKDRGISFNNFMRVDTDGNPTLFARTANASAVWAYANVRRSNAFVTLDHGFDNGWSARLSVNQTRLDHDQLFGFARGDIDALTGASSFEYGRTAFTPRTTGMNLHLTGPYDLFGRRHTLMAGLSHEGLKASDPLHRYRFDIPIDDIDDHARTGRIDVDAPAVIGLSKTRIRQGGGYVATRLNPMDGLSVIAGARLSSYRLLDNYSDIRENAVVTPYLGVVGDLTRQVSAYASYTTIFNPQSYQDRSGRALEPEKGKNYEVGLKGAFLDGRLNASAALFWTRKDNLALWDEGATTPSGVDAYTAADNTRASGYELEVSGEPMRNWHVMAGFAQAVVRDRDGARLLQELPARQLKLFTSYAFGGPLTGLTLGAGMSWQSRTSHPYDTNPVLDQGSFAIFNLMARYRLDRHWSASLYAANLTDKTYLSTVWYHNYGTPRNITLRVRYDF